MSTIRFAFVNVMNAKLVGKTYSSLNIKFLKNNYELKKS